MVVAADLLSDARQVLRAQARVYVTLPILLGVCRKESGLNGLFNNTDKLLHDNIVAASRFVPYSRDQIASAFLIDEGPNKGLICKWRCEPAYWGWVERLVFVQQFTPAQRIRLCASVGIGQKMTRWLVANTHWTTWADTMSKFMSSRKLQLLHCAGDIDNLIIGAHKDIASANKVEKHALKGADPLILAYSRYNAGPRSGITDYGKIVDGYVREFADVR